MANSAAPQDVRDKASGLYWLFFVIYALFAFYFYLAVIGPYLYSGDVYGPRLLADAITYEAICTIERDILDLASLRDIGPCLGLWIFSYNSGLLSFLNLFFIVASVRGLARTYQRPWKPMLALVLINPVMFASMYGANKEVFGFVSFSMFAIYIRSRSFYSLLFCVITALFTRIPAFVTTVAFVIFLITVLPKSGTLTPSEYRRYWLYIAGISIVSSLIALLYGSTLQDNLLGDFSRAEDVSRSTEFSLSLNAISRAGGYLFVYLTRVVLNFYSGVVGITNLLHGEGANYYTVAVVGSSAIFIMLTIRLMIVKIPKDLSNTAEAWTIILFSVFTTELLCLSPVIQQRYFFPIYVFLVLFSFKPKTESPYLRKN